MSGIYDRLPAAVRRNDPEIGERLRGALVAAYAEATTAGDCERRGLIEDAEDELCAFGTTGTGALVLAYAGVGAGIDACRALGITPEDVATFGPILSGWNSGN